MDKQYLMRNIPANREDRKLVSYAEYVERGGYEMLEKALLMQPADIVSKIKDAELRGRGGAGFPCGMKWSFLPEADGLSLIHI